MENDYYLYLLTYQLHYHIRHIQLNLLFQS